MNDKTVKDIFNKFVGRSINVLREKDASMFAWSFKIAETDPADKTLQEMEKKAEEAGLRMTVRSAGEMNPPSMEGTLVVSLAKQKTTRDWRISRVEYNPKGW